MLIVKKIVHTPSSFAPVGALECSLGVSLAFGPFLDGIDFLHD
jgi:hypothetical protein